MEKLQQRDYSSVKVGSYHSLFSWFMLILPVCFIKHLYYLAVRDVVIIFVGCELAEVPC